MKLALVLCLILAGCNRPETVAEATPFRGNYLVYAWVKTSQGYCPPRLGWSIKFDDFGRIMEPFPGVRCDAYNHPPLMVDCGSPFGELHAIATDDIFDRNGYPAARGIVNFSGSAFGCSNVSGRFLLYAADSGT